ncbi:zinc-binding dehydrogenase [Rhodococcus opacus]|uniref:Zinc-binding dehydrogenase n=1 Tax=Rhodococcus opacus TaxID=37919 RepID=A0ABT4NSV9_RHOOP|nr:zinc-binding dehydrogenase [Rhodococcus opacus]MCZ4590467.1 zinc-binding dehydrogenase [Rhodococcus opacus]MDV7087582.1 zinc-binding dehydrogenase [Rhodococcus opacus]
MTKTMQCKAAVLVEYGSPLEIQTVSIPATLETNALLVRNRMATVCGTDVHLCAGHAMASTSVGKSLPIVAGHEAVGEIVDMNNTEYDSVGNRLEVGDRVIWTHGFCGSCRQCTVENSPTLCERRRGYMAAGPEIYPHLNGTFAEYGYVFPTSGRVRVPSNISDAVASAASCALRTMVHAFDRLGRIQERQSVVIQGAGPLGLFAVALAKESGASSITVVGGPSARLALATEWGADNVIDISEVPSAEDRAEVTRQLTGGRGADVVIEASGATTAFTEGLGILARGGRYVLVGQLHANSIPVNPSQIVVKHATVVGSVSGAVNHYARGLEFLSRHADSYDWDRMISSVRPLEKINDAIAAMTTEGEIKPAVSF